MQSATVMLIALCGLGCYNKDCSASVAPPISRDLAGYSDPGVYSHASAQAAYMSYPPSRFDGYDPSDGSCRAVLRATLCSFVLGRDPGVATARDNEASFYSGRNRPQ
jgi:hypothetical protein